MKQAYETYGTHMGLWKILIWNGLKINVWILIKVMVTCMARERIGRKWFFSFNYHIEGAGKNEFKFISIRFKS